MENVGKITRNISVISYMFSIMVTIRITVTAIYSIRMKCTWKQSKLAWYHRIMQKEIQLEKEIV